MMFLKIDLLWVFIICCETHMRNSPHLHLFPPMGSPYGGGFPPLFEKIYMKPYCSRSGYKLSVQYCTWAISRTFHIIIKIR